MPFNIRDIFKPKPIELLQDEPGEDIHKGGQYKKNLTALDLTLLGVGGIIGAGIFTLTGITARTEAGPDAEVAAMIPISGSAYSYTYATMGEFIAWLLGWDLILEYLVGSAAVAVGWAYYLEYFLHKASDGAINFDAKLNNAPWAWDEDNNKFVKTDSQINLPAFLGVIVLTLLLISGIKQSAWVINTFVGVKLVVILMFIFGGAKYTNSANLQPFTPFGADGVFKGAITVFFAYIGFDAVSTTAQEAANPKKDLPIGIIGSLAICTVLYVSVCLVLSTLVPYNLIKDSAPVANAIVQAGGPQWFGTILAFGALCGLTSVMMVLLIGQPRIFRAMAFDGLFPRIFAYIHPKTGTPIVTTAITGSISAIAAGFLPIDVLANLTSVGTLFAFFCVAAALMVMRYREPERERPFKVPGGRIGGYVFPGITMALIIILLWRGGTNQTVARVFIWAAVGLIVYFSFGFWNSKLRYPHKHGITENQQTVVVEAGEFKVAGKE
ncbi:hypothetical protein HDU76_006354 [Blyttiomyces sp. JEL0837]|nr:hypothetical protein HDU76_006354 [Blyttiomyces sp. JEL0837]